MGTSASTRLRVRPEALPTVAHARADGSARMTVRMSVERACPACGRERAETDRFCPQCGHAFAAEPAAEHEEPGWRRGGVLPANVSEGALATTVEPTWRSIQSPWLVAALVFATFDLYALWWLGRTWWQIKQEDGDAGKRPVWHVLAMFVPFYGYFRFYAHMRAIVAIAATPEARAVMSPLAMTVAWIVINLLSGVTLLNPQTPGWVPILASGLSAAQFGWAQYGLNTAWSSLPGGATRGRAHPLHWILIGLGAIFYALAALIALVGLETPPA